MRKVVNGTSQGIPRWWCCLLQVASAVGHQHRGLAMAAPQETGVYP